MAHFLRGFVVKGVKLVVSAFAEAYKNVSIGRAQGAPDAAQQATKAVDRIFRGGMKIGEARLVLDVKKDTPVEEINAKFEKLYFKNTVENNGTFYIQSKIYRAKQAIDAELELEKEELEAQAKKA